MESGLVEAAVRAGGTHAPTRREAVVVLAGEVDVAAHERTWSVLREALAQAPHLVVDCTNVTFMDTTGPSLLVAARVAAGPHGSVIVRNPSGPVRQLLELVGLDDTFIG
jgi:anti-anti-sigma factor